MATYAYTARNTEGRTVSGVVTADSQQAALRLLDEQALFPVSIEEGGVASKSRVTGQRKRIKLSTVAVMYAQFADLLRAGVPALRALDTLCKQSSNAALAEVLREVREDLSGGQTLADAMAKHPNAFAELHVSMIRAGEKGGFLEDVLARIAAFTERQDELRNKLLGAMMYPMLLMMVGTGVVIFLLLKVVPQVRQFLRGELPAMTQFVFGLCDVLRDHGVKIAGALVIAVILIMGVIRSEAGRLLFDRLKLRAPMIGPIITLVAICRFCRILGTLLHNGVPILQSLKVARDSAGNRILQEHIDAATESVRKGESLASPLGAARLFPLDIIDMIAVGEESNNLDNVLVTIADSYEARTARKIDLAVRLLEPILLVVMAVVVGTIAVALLLPILTMSGSAM
ncbi:MAG: type II secretion system F family protein [Phycisphaerae bacterium]|nr:type II secretion system F family protein [Phycisphaerae bacterium]